MQATRLAVVAATGILVMAACGSTSTGGPGNPGSGGTTGSISASISEYQHLSLEVRSTATAYRTAMKAAVTANGCRAIHNQYDALVRPSIARMGQLAREMDDYIVAHAGAGAADMRCACATMMDELDYHRSRACTFSTIAADDGEAVRHANAMYSYATHVHARCGEMLGSGSGSMCCDWGPVMNGCGNWASTCCSSMMHGGCCGHMMTGGGMHSGSCCSSNL